MPDILTYDAQTNRYRSTGAGKRAYRPDDIEILSQATRIFPTAIVNRKETDNLKRHLESLPPGADGIVVWPYEQPEPAENEAEKGMVRVAPYRFTERGRKKSSLLRI